MGPVARRSPEEMASNRLRNAYCGALVSNPVMVTGLARIGEAAKHVFGGGNRALGHASSGPCLQQNLVCVVEGRS